MWAHNQEYGIDKQCSHLARGISGQLQGSITVEFKIILSATRLYQNNISLLVVRVISFQAHFERWVEDLDEEIFSSELC